MRLSDATLARLFRCEWDEALLGFTVDALLAELDQFAIVAIASPPALAHHTPLHRSSSDDVASFVCRFGVALSRMPRCELALMSAPASLRAGLRALFERARHRRGLDALSSNDKAVFERFEGTV